MSGSIRQECGCGGALRDAKTEDFDHALREGGFALTRLVIGGLEIEPAARLDCTEAAAATSTGGMKATWFHPLAPGGTP